MPQRSTVSNGPTPFRNNIAVVIGIDRYQSGIHELRTAANDARRLGQILKDQHGYAVQVILDEQATRERIHNLFAQELAPGPDDRVLFYFAGHGVALDGDDGPNGYLLPQDARPDDPSSFIKMPWLHDALNALDCRHLMVILDSCFGGAFRWSAMRGMRNRNQTLHQERYDRFVQDPAWQVITSASHDQEALDVLRTNRFGTRGELNGHSPFAIALFEALAGKTDVGSRDQQDLLETLARDGVITATELYLYLSDVLQSATIAAGNRQTPRIWPLKKHDKGEFIFHVPGHELNLPPAPPLNYDNNPYLGLKSFDQKHASLFFGRDAEIAQLSEFVASHPLTAVLGASGTGKSSLVKAGLVPKLSDDVEGGWSVLPIVRPGSSPLEAIGRAIGINDSDADDETVPTGAAWLQALATRISESVAARFHSEPVNTFLLVIDQFEELVTMTRQPEQRDATLELLCSLLQDHPKRLRIVVTLRTDFEPQFNGTVLKDFWDDGRFVVPPMTREGLRQVIEEPASLKVLYFQPSSLVDTLVDEVADTPGGLPLLSFALSEMYIRYVGRKSSDRAITEEDYKALGGVVGALRSRADEEFEALDKSHRDTMRRLMLRMVVVEGGNIARQRVDSSDLVYPDESETKRMQEIVRQLTEARLLVSGKDDHNRLYVEPAHDALVRAWDKLTVWIHNEEGRQANLRFQKSMGLATLEWDRAETKNAKQGLLWRDSVRGGLLAQLVHQEEDRLPRVSITLLQRIRRDVRAFWKTAGSTGAAAESTWMNLRELAFARRSIRRRRNVRIGLAMLSMLIVAGGVAASVFAVQASRQRDTAISRSLASQSQVQLESRLDLALLLSVEATRISETIEAKSSLLSAALSNPHLERFLYTPGYLYGNIRFENDGQDIVYVGCREAGKHFLECDSAGVREDRYSVETGQFLGRNPVPFENQGGPSSEVAYDVSSGDTLSAYVSLGDNRRDVGSCSSYYDFEPWYCREIVVISGADTLLLIAHRNMISGLSLSQDGKRLASASIDGMVAIWKTSPSESHLRAWKTASADVAKTIVSPNGKYVLEITDSGAIRLFDTSTDREFELASEPDPGSQFRSWFFSKNGSILVATASDGSLAAWRVADKSAHVSRLDLDQGQDTVFVKGPVYFSNDNSTVAAVTAEDNLYFWNVSENIQRGYASFNASSTGFTSALSFGFANSTFLKATCSSIDEYVGCVRVTLLGSSFRSQTAETGLRYSSNPDTLASVNLSLPSVRFSDDGSHLVAFGCNYDGPSECVGWGFEVIDTRSGEGFSKDQRGLRVRTAAFSPEANYVATTQEDLSIRLWNLSTDELFRTIETSNGAIVTIAFSSDGELIAAGSCVGDYVEPSFNTAERCSESAVRIWHVATGLSIGPILKGPSGLIRSLVFTPGSERLIAQSDEDVTGWNLTLASWQKEACRRANRNLTPIEWNRFIGPAIPYRETCPDLLPVDEPHDSAARLVR